MLPHVGPTSYRCCLPTLHHKSALHHTAGPTSYKQVLHHTAGPTPYSRSYIIQVLPAHSAKNCTDLVCDSLLLHPISAFNHYAFTCDISSAPTLLLPNADRCTGTLFFVHPISAFNHYAFTCAFSSTPTALLPNADRCTRTLLFCIPSRHSTNLLPLT